MRLLTSHKRDIAARSVSTWRRDVHGLFFALQREHKFAARVGALELQVPAQAAGEPAAEREA